MADTDPWEKPASVSAAVPTADPWEKPAAPQEKNAGTKREHGVIDKLFGLGTERYQTWPERAVRDVAGIPKRAIEAATSGPPGSREVSKNLIAPAADAAMAFSPLSRGGKAITKSARVGEVPDREKHIEAANKGYKELRGDPARVKQDVIAGLEDKIKDELIENGHREYNPNDKGIFQAIEELSKPYGKGTPGDVEAVRQVLINMGKGSGADASKIAREAIDDYMMNIPDASKTAKDARGNWAAQKRSGMYQEQVLQRGEDNAVSTGLGGNLPNTLRQRLKSVLYDKRTSRFLSQEEKDGIRDALKRNTFDGLLEKMSRLGPKHPLTGWGMAAIAEASKGKMLAAGSLGLGALGQKLAEMRMRGKVNKLDEATRARSPLSQERPIKNVEKTPKGKMITVPFMGSSVQESHGENIPDLVNRLGQ